MNLNALRERVRCVVDDLVCPEGTDVEVGDLTDALREVADGLEDLDRLAHTLAGALDCEPELGVLADRVDEVAAWGDEAHAAREHLVNRITGRAEALGYPPARLRQVEERIGRCGIHELLAEGRDMDRQLDQQFRLSPTAQPESEGGAPFVDVAGFQA